MSKSISIRKVLLSNTKRIFKKLREESNEVRKEWTSAGIVVEMVIDIDRDPRILGSWATTIAAKWPDRYHRGSSRKMHGFHVGSTRVRGNSRNKPAWRTRRAMCRTWGSQWRSMARASSIRSTRSNISPAGIAGGTWTGLNPTRRMLSTVNQASHRKPSTGHR